MFPLQSPDYLHLDSAESVHGLLARLTKAHGFALQTAILGLDFFSPGSVTSYFSHHPSRRPCHAGDTQNALALSAPRMLLVVHSTP